MRKPLSKINSESLERRTRRKLKIRKSIVGTAERPRVNVFRSNKNLSVQVVDDKEGKTLFSLHSFGKSKVEGAAKNKEGAKVLGSAVAKKLSDLGVKTAVFDRNGFKYHGVVASLADGIRENGIQI